MSINWVMLDTQLEFVRLPGEKPVYKSPPRTALALTTPKTYPANGPVSIHSDSGTLYLTNQRVVYLPSKPVDGFESFSAPLLNLHDSHITVPWFGPNAWQALVQPISGGNLPIASTGIELKLTFKEGGAPDFHSNFERIKERLHQAVEASNLGRRPDGFLNGINMDSVHLDQLPTYEASGQDRVAPDDITSAPSAEDASSSVEPASSSTIIAPGRSATTNPPADAPPGYEEAQQQSVEQEFERRLSGR